MTYPATRRALLQTAGLGLAGLPFLVAQPGLAAAATGKQYKIALSNSYIGNKWRLEMENVFKAALLMEPFKSEVIGSVYNSGNDVSKQSQQISNLIAERVDAIVIDAASPTALNGIIRQATSRGILVVAFDNAVTAPSAITVNVSQYDLGKGWAEWIVKQVGGKGNVIMVTGVAGTQVDLDRNKGADEVWAKNPGIKVVNRFTGMWDSSTAERNTAAVLPSLPKIDAIWCQGGTDGVLKAFIAANRPLPPTAGEAENGFRKMMLGIGGHKVVGYSSGSPPYLSLMALELARRILNGTYPKKSIDVPNVFLSNADLKLGVNVFADQPDSFFDDFTAGGPTSPVDICAAAAISGAACTNQKLYINLPKA
ncbi:sugar ABC transporter substrate-binding protein [Acidisoma sp. C75]